MNPSSEKIAKIISNITTEQKRSFLLWCLNRCGDHLIFWNECEKAFDTLKKHREGKTTQEDIEKACKLSYGRNSFGVDRAIHLACLVEASEEDISNRTAAAAHYIAYAMSWDIAEKSIKKRSDYSPEMLNRFSSQFLLEKERISAFISERRVQQSRLEMMFHIMPSEHDGVEYFAAHYISQDMMNSLSNNPLE